MRKILHLGVVLSVLFAGCSQVAPMPGERVSVSVESTPAMLISPPAREKSIADLEDQGALLQYSRTALPAQTGGLTWFPVQISEAHALKSIATGKMAFVTPDGRELVLRYLRHTEQLQGNWSWIGRLEGDALGRSVIFTFGKHAVFGSIPDTATTALSIQTRAGKLFVVKSNPSMVSMPSWGDDAIAVPESSSDALAAASARAVHAGAKGFERDKISGANAVDVVIGYTAGFRDALGGASQAVTRLAYLVEYGNLALYKSEVSGYLRLVGTVGVDYPDNTSNNSALDALQDTGSPTLAPLRTARDSYGGDVALLVRRFTKENDGCGVAYVLGGNLKPITNSSASWAYGVVSDGSYRDGSSTWHCTDSTLAHEGGHLLGLTHDRANSTQPGHFPYSYGYNANGVCDIMAYCDSGNTEFQVYSNPRITICAGKPCGVEDSEDNARSINQTLPLIAGFRATVVPFLTRVRHDVNGDGRSDVFWHNPNLGLEYWLMNGSSWSYGGLRSVASKYEVVGVGDFNGDGRADVLWRDTAKTELWMWQAKSDGSFGVHLLRTYPSGWTVAGIGDVNGDGRDDIIWHNPEAGLEYWLMNGTSWAYGGLRPVASKYEIIGVGDFNGDGLADVLWRDKAKTELWMWQAKTDGYFSASLLRGYPSGWGVVGVGDINGDGRDDVVWHNPSAGLEYWLMNGVTWVYGGLRPVSSKYEVVDVGDYNGDGLADVLWRDTAKTELWSWQAKPGGTFDVNFLRNYPVGWNIVR